MGGGWQGSQRKQALTPEFLRLRPIVLQRDNHTCTWIPALDEPDPLDSKAYPAGVTVHKESDPLRYEMCGDTATDVDHVKGPEDSLTNLRALCGWHHDIKSSREGNDARWADSRTKEHHSGILRDSGGGN